MNFLRQWIFGILICALLVGFFEQLPLTGAMQKMVHFTGGLLLILSILQPISGIDLGELSFDFAAYEEAVAELEADYTEDRQQMLSSGIAERLRAYIEDKASALGLCVQAVVSTEFTDGIPYPKSVTLYGQENEALSDWITAELGIAKENQVWKEP